ncbi:MAG: PilZ domain-containing protein [Candidatus Omnitrophota bacterium]
MFRKKAEEKRKFVRLETHHLLKYKLMDRKESLSFARNVSAGGVRFHAEEYIQPGSTLELTINFPSYPEPVKAVSKVVWVTPMAKLGGFDVGAEFINIEEKARDFIKEKISKVCKRKK